MLRFGRKNSDSDGDGFYRTSRYREGGDGSEDREKRVYRNLFRFTTFYLNYKFSATAFPILKQLETISASI